MSDLLHEGAGGAVTGTARAALDARGLTKRFAGQAALDDVDLAVAPGEVHGLVGHNGSGKSTLIKILAGFHAADAGEVVVSGHDVRHHDPDDSRRAGMRFIHQDLGLVDQMTVLENLKLGTDAWDTGLGARIRWRREIRRARELMAGFGVHLEPRVLVSELSPVERTQLAIVRALQEVDGVRLLVLDEPTATLPDSEVDRLLELLGRIRQQGIGILYVSHRLEELYRVCDSLTVLRDGKVVARGDIAAIPQADLVRLITGASEMVSTRSASRPDSRGDVCLSSRGLAGGHLVSLDIEARAGEVLGVAGLVGSGIHDLVRILSGRTPATAGELEVNGVVMTSIDPFRLKSAGLAVLPSARELKGIQGMSVRENLMITDLGPVWRRGRIDRRRERQLARALVEQYDIRPADPERELSTLSGGNQQKVVVAKWIRTGVSVLVLDEPTAGVDVAGRAYVLQALKRAASSGLCVVLCSADLDDLTEICDRVVVLREGRNVAEMSAQPLDRHAIASECLRSA